MGRHLFQLGLRGTSSIEISNGGRDKTQGLSQDLLEGCYRLCISTISIGCVHFVTQTTYRLKSSGFGLNAFYKYLPNADGIQPGL